VVKKRLGPRSENPYAVAAIELLLLTGCRLGEVLNLRWSDVDIERRFLLLPDSKTGAKCQSPSKIDPRSAFNIDPLLA
jgi:integrase